MLKVGNYIISNRNTYGITNNRMLLGKIITINGIYWN
jgi:hypothetical protein